MSSLDFIRIDCLRSLSGTAQAIRFAANDQREIPESLQPAAKRNHLTGTIAGTLFAILFACTYGPVCLADEPAAPPAAMPAKHAAVFKQYCYDCHDAGAEEGGVNLEDISFDIARNIETAERWQKILNAINSGEMPPEDSEPISDKAKIDFLEDLSTRMVVARKLLSDTGGEITMRRLNRREYQNTIEALLGVRPDVSSLPDDQATAGFDTVGASLFFSSDQLENYLATAKATLQMALATPHTAKMRTVRIEPEEEYTPHYANALAALQDNIKRATAWKSQSEKPASEFGFLDEYAAKKSLENSKKWAPQLEQYLARPETKTGATLILTIKDGGYTKIKFPALGPENAGNYTIRLRAAAYPDADPRFQYVEFSSGFGSGRKHLGWRKVTGTLDDPEIITFPIEHRPGEKLQIWIHQRSHQDRGDKNLWTIDQQNNGIGTPPGVWIDWAELVGPDSDPDGSASIAARNLILPTKPSDWSYERYAKEVLHDFAVRAFRGESPSADYLNRLVQQYEANRAKGLTQTDALIGPLSIILSSPSFLYLVESTGNEGSPDLTAAELAVRLSYFLWSESPDQELMSLARSGQLSQPRVLFAQTSRLLADPRADRFVRGFVHQWLQMERLDMFQFDGVQFPTFDNAVRANAREEIFATVHHMLEEKLPLGTLLKTDFAVVNDVMADYYGLPGVEGHEFRKVKLPPDSLRGGLLGTAAVAAMGSDGLRSSPVERGAWVLRHLLNDPPPPAPPNVPQLSRLAGEVLSARELTKAHQEEPQCAQCHQKIDPIGFALENFDASGMWRDVETVMVGERRNKRAVEFEIDGSGRLPSGEQFANYQELRDAVAQHEDDFAMGLTEALIEYGLGRPNGFTDQDLADQILEYAKAKDYELSVFVHALVQSKQFKTK